MYNHYNRNQSRNFIKIVKEIHKLQCQSCGYSRIQDTKRDWYCEELEILEAIHKKTFTDHVIAMIELDNQELQKIISARRLQIAAKRRENLSAVAECMKELSKLDRNSLVGLWEEYSR